MSSGTFFFLSVSSFISLSVCCAGSSCTGGSCAGGSCAGGSCVDSGHLSRMMCSSFHKGACFAASPLALLAVFPPEGDLWHHPTD